MSNVTLTIGGRSFTVACAEGEEDHVSGLGQMINDKLSAMGDMSGQSESRMLLFASLLLADELHEAQFRSVAPTPAPATSETPQHIVERIDAIADQLENLATALEAGRTSA